MASFSVPCPKLSSSLQCTCSGLVRSAQQHHFNEISFRLGPNSRHSSLIYGCSIHRPPTYSQFQPHDSKQAACWRLQALVNEVAVEKPSNSTVVPETKSGADLSDVKDETPEKVSVQNPIPDASLFSAFLSKVSDLVKFVDSKDIMELQLKQLDCELTIRKKEAVQPPPPAAPVFAMQYPLPQSVHQSPPPPAQVLPPVSAGSSPSAAAPVLAIPAKTNNSSHPTLKCPMAGTFYRCPAPGEPQFVKVGDKVAKGQVLCIIEAMKLMNEIEADQSGTISEVLVEDGKPVSLDTPLFVIAP
ncbi:unnamed protein product [Ilex paraguariensis]|uniref:Biotin carboxyl carrier protein of acetyl-CoA carboxylase n=1 Tax=Ilex paraguariensis TaxID=185542 RepID=A0ABC8UY56_9AQUA